MRTGDSAAMRSGSGWTRRDFLKVGGAGALGLGLDLGVAGATARASTANSERSVILLLLVGGPSQLETFDPKPDAPTEIRGPFASIATAVPGVRISEHLPRLARHLDRVTLIRSLTHDAAPIHETGFQLLQTGRLSRLEGDHPHLGSIAAQQLGGRRAAPPFVVLPRPLGNTGVGVWRGQSGGPLGLEFDPFVLNADPNSREFRAPSALWDLTREPASIRDAYGRTTFGQSCLLARRLVESGTRVVTVNMYDTVFNRVSWDCHGSRHFSTLDDYAREVLPTFDQAFTALIEDLARRGRLDSTMVVASGEFGRSPRLNAAGGRDHWPSVWSAVLAGGGSRGGQVIGASDAHAAEPADRPITPADLVATMGQTLGIDWKADREESEGDVPSGQPAGSPVQIG